jgi:lipoate-protein ligase A
MADRFRLLRTGFNNAYFNMGLDEAILGSVEEGKSLPTLRLYGWKPAAISIGYFQGMREEIDVEACAAQGVDIVRRITGGGAVFHDSELTYSLAIPEGHRLAPRSIQDSYHMLCDGIVQGLARLGIRAEFAPINDIVSGGKKVSGNAQTRKRGCLLQHGTILLEVDVEKMFSLLKVPKEKALGKMIEDVKARVTSVSALLGRPVGFGEAEAAILAGFVSSLGIECLPEEASAEELSAAQNLARDRFSTPEWLFRR